MNFLKKVLTDKDIWLGIAMIIFALFLINNAKAEGPSAPLYNKPVICAPTLDAAMEMLSQVKKDGMKPLMYFYGNSFNGDGSGFKSDFFVMFDADDDQVTIVERQPMNGFTCLLAGGTGTVVFDPEELKGLIGWNDIP